MKPEKLIYTVPGGDAYERGYNQAYRHWREYHNWYIKEKCIKKEERRRNEPLNITHRNNG